MHSRPSTFSPLPSHTLIDPKRVVALAVLTAGIMGTMGAFQPAAELPTSRQVHRLFEKPPREYSTGPLWVWNDLLTEEQIRETLRDLASQKVRQVWVHPRPGLMTPYLGEDWFRLWKVALKEAERLDMNVWIYDENSYPSGFAGGHVPRAMPESRGRGLVLREVKSATIPATTKETIAIYREADPSSSAGTGWRKLGTKDGDASDASDSPSKVFLVASQVRDGDSPWHANGPYVNLLTPGVTEKFLEITLEPYRRQFGAQFGKRIPGVFTDEPNIRPAGDLPWSEELPDAFRQRWGYDLLDHLPSLFRPVGDWRKIRHNYYQLLHEQFVQHWAKPYHDYCERYGLQFTGHYWDHDWPHCHGVPDNMAMYAWHQTPAIDCLMNRYSETGDQFGNVRMARELSSVANQLGMPRTLCEVYGAGGWDLEFDDMKRIGDWLQVLGVNTLNEHLSYVTIRGARKRDHPQSFSYHEPWWEAYHLNAEYFTRLSAALSQGQQINRILLLEPTSTAWMYQRDNQRLDEIRRTFTELVNTLEAAQIEYDIGCEDLIAHHGSASPGGGKLTIGNRDYETLVIPPLTENLNKPTRDLLGKSRVKILNLAGTVSYTDGAADTSIAKGSSETQTIPTLLPQLSAIQQRTGLHIQRAQDDKGILFHHRRQLADGELLFLVNTSDKHPTKATIHSNKKSVEQWDLTTGRRERFSSQSGRTGLQASLELPPCGSRLLFLSPAPVSPNRDTGSPAQRFTVLPASGTTEIERFHPNVLVLDHVDVSAGGETRTNLYYYQANQFVWRQNGMQRNPWDSAVQYKDELITRKFGPDTGFTATYRFHIRGSVPRGLAFVLERPDLYAITVNGKTVDADQKEWWLDKAFRRIDLAGLGRPGENTVTITAKPFTILHELESAYVLGDFSLLPLPEEESTTLAAGPRTGFLITADRPLNLGSEDKSLKHTTVPENNMWLTEGIGFHKDSEGKPIADRTPWIVFDLGKETTVTAAKIWQYNESSVRNNTQRGAQSIRITPVDSPESGDRNSSQATLCSLKRAAGSQVGPETIALKPNLKTRYLRFDILSNHNGAEYPPSGEVDDNGFVGLGEVQFLDGAGQPLSTAVARFSSQLVSHQRFANNIVDGSGLGTLRRGWNTQGHPFYSWDVAYRQKYDLSGKNGRYLVRLPDWSGSVARVRVNGKEVGWITAPPYECDITRRIKKGENVVEVSVVGTLKNTLGPHHGNPGLGAAWPGNFHNAPDGGLPPGANYHTVAYGLFAPFEVLQAAP